MKTPYRVSDYFNATSPPANQVPYYRLRRLKLENLALSSAHEFEVLSAGHAIDVQAFVYAQEGSWLVLAGDLFDGRVRQTGAGRTYLDLNNNGSANCTASACEYADLNGNRALDTNEGADLDRDGFVSRAERIAPYRFARYNYKISFRGAIMEKQSAIINDPDGGGPALGVVADWMNKWATTQINADNFNGAGASDTFRNNLSYGSGDFSNITYAFDDEVMRGNFDEDEGFHLPIAPQFFYQG